MVMYQPLYAIDVEFPVQNEGVQKICYTARVGSPCTSGMYLSAADVDNRYHDDRQASASIAL